MAIDGHCFVPRLHDSLRWVERHILKSSNQLNAETRRRVMPHVQHPVPHPVPLGSVWAGSLLPCPSHSDSRVHAVSALSFSSSRKPDLSGDIGLLGSAKESKPLYCVGRYSSERDSQAREEVTTCVLTTMHMTESSRCGASVLGSSPTRFARPTTSAFAFW